MVPGAGCPAVSPRAHGCAVSMAGHRAARQAHAANVWELCNTFLYEQKSKANQPVAFVKCHHLKRTTKISANLKVLAAAVRFGRKSPLIERKVWRLESCLLHALGVWKCQVFKGKRWRIKLCFIYHYSIHKLSKKNYSPQTCETFYWRCSRHTRLMELTVILQPQNIRQYERL